MIDDPRDSRTRWSVYWAEHCRFGLVHAAQPRRETRRSADALSVVGRDAGIRVAIADGCSESPAGGAWAQQLCDSARSDEMIGIKVADQGLAAIYQHARDHYRRPDPATPRQARFMRQVPHDEATFLVADVDLHEGDEAAGVTANIAAVGDTQILVLDPRTQPESWPLQSLAEFTPPDLMSSLAPAGNWTDTVRTHVRAGLALETVFVVCTDEVARWLLSSVENQQLAALRHSLAELLAGQGQVELSELSTALPAALRSDDDLTLGVFTLLRPGGEPGAPSRRRSGLLYAYDPVNACVRALQGGAPR